MTYNKEDITKRVKKKQRDFITKAIISFLGIAASSAIAFIFSDVTVVFIGVVAVIGFCVYLFKTVKRYRPAIIFSKEITGINIKEHEFVVTNRRTTFSARRSFYRIRPKTFTGGKTRTKPPTSAIVYLKLPDGDVTFIDKLTNAQTDEYEIGDTLYKYPGTRYPIIVGRAVKAQPCPICGTANKASEERCITCGLRTN